MLGDEVARLGELEQQFGLVKNSAADMKAAGCTRRIEIYLWNSLWST